MPLYEIVREKIMDFVRQYGTDEIRKTSEIIDIVGFNMSPADFCYNRTNRGLFDDDEERYRKLFIKTETYAHYKIVGENYPYTGEVIWHEKETGREHVIGLYTDGVFTGRNGN